MDSLINQKTNFDYEILIGEDCSDDLTRRICIDYAKRFPEKSQTFSALKKIILRLMNSTQAVLMCYIIYIHQGKYIAFCEGDDFWLVQIKS